MTPFRLRSHARWLVPVAAVTAACAILGHAEVAEACGGLFCSSANPVNQTAERIIFATNGDGTITCIVEIQYEGPSESFSWILPVPGTPGVDVSSTAALDRLQQASNPTYQLQTNIGPGCDGLARNANFAPSAGGFGEDEGGDGVTVVASGTTGPYLWEVINVDNSLPDPADVAVDWLTLNGYDLPPNGREVLRPYLVDGLNLIGFKLTKTASAGSIRPVILNYNSDRPFIPIRPTAVAATEDMGILVWVLGDSRAVPINYRTLELNESLIDWFNPNTTYNKVVIAAANEAGGQGFVTEQSGAAGGFAETIWATWEQDQLASLREPSLSVPNLLVQATQTLGFLDGFADVLRETVALRAGWTAEDFVSCASCYYQEVGIDPYGAVSPPVGSEPSLAMDRAAFFAALDEDVIVPMLDTRQVFLDHAYVTRMYTTLSADEMTVDPKFDFNPELEDVSNVHVATQTLSCFDNGTGSSPWNIQLPNGVVMKGEGTAWPVAVGEDLPANQRVLQLSTSGSGEVIEDNTEVIESHFADDASGCGCRTAGGGAASRGWLLVAGAAIAGLGLRRRRLGA